MKWMVKKPAILHRLLLQSNHNRGITINNNNSHQPSLAWTQLTKSTATFTCIHTHNYSSPRLLRLTIKGYHIHTYLKILNRRRHRSRQHLLINRTASSLVRLHRVVSNSCSNNSSIILQSLYCWTRYLIKRYFHKLGNSTLTLNKHSSHLTSRNS